MILLIILLQSCQQQKKLQYKKEKCYVCRQEIKSEFNYDKTGRVIITERGNPIYIEKICKNNHTITYKLKK